MSDLSYGRDRLGDAEASARLEWLVTNGIGGFASGTVSGALTRRYHGLLVASLKPPVGRTLLLAKLAESLDVGGAWVDLDENRWASGTASPSGALHLESFRLDETVPVWTWAIGDTRLEKRVWMEHGENTTFIEYRLAAASAPARLYLRALVNHRDVHETTTNGAWTARVEPAADGSASRPGTAPPRCGCSPPGPRCGRSTTGTAASSSRSRPNADSTASKTTCARPRSSPRSIQARPS
jgi:glycogen debranching enzyme